MSNSGVDKENFIFFSASLCTLQKITLKTVFSILKVSQNRFNLHFLYRNKCTILLKNRTFQKNKLKSTFVLI